MAKSNESKLNIKDLTDAEIYDAIRCLEQDPGIGNGEDDRSALICICLFIALLVGLAFLWTYR
jgi:hypothetical protein